MERLLTRWGKTLDKKIKDLYALVNAMKEGKANA